MADNISRTTIRSFLFYRIPYLSTVLILILSSSGTRNGQWNSFLDGIFAKRFWRI